MQPTHYDIIFAGAGLSGLTLALELARRPAFQDKKILLLDRDRKQQNDRTWCFWATDAEPMPPVVYKSWDRCRFYAPGFDCEMNIAPYRYRMVRGIDFYNWANAELDRCPNVQRLHTTISDLDAGRGLVRTDAGDFTADIVFNSAFVKTPVLPAANAVYKNPPFSLQSSNWGCVKSPLKEKSQTEQGIMFGKGADFGSLKNYRNLNPLKKGNQKHPFRRTPAAENPPCLRVSAVKKNAAKSIFLLQHFKGWIIETQAPAFEPDAVTFMDFRIEQQGETRFVYVLPFSETRALVEFTVFSPELLAPEEYDGALRGYLRDFLKISDFKIEEQEFGVIPMTDFPFPTRQEGRVVHIGTAGGFVKASSGYAFKRTQRKVRAFADAWERTGRPDARVFQSPWIFQIFDSIFLRVLHDRNELGSIIFKNLFKKLPSTLVLRFLDEDSSPFENLRLVSAPPAGPFLRALFKKLATSCALFCTTNAYKST